MTRGYVETPREREVRIMPEYGPSRSDEMTDDTKITRDEMIAMFGEAMPAEAVGLLLDAPADWTLAQLRTELRKLADPVRRLCNAAQALVDAMGTQPASTGLHLYWSNLRKALLRPIPATKPAVVTARMIEDATEGWGIGGHSDGTLIAGRDAFIAQHVTAALARGDA